MVARARFELTVCAPLRSALDARHRRAAPFGLSAAVRAFIGLSSVLSDTFLSEKSQKPEGRLLTTPPVSFLFWVRKWVKKWDAGNKENELYISVYVEESMER